MNGVTTEAINGSVGTVPSEKHVLPEPSRNLPAKVLN